MQISNHYIICLGIIHHYRWYLTIQPPIPQISYLTCLPCDPWFGKSWWFSCAASIHDQQNERSNSCNLSFDLMSTYQLSNKLYHNSSRLFSISPTPHCRAPDVTPQCISWEIWGFVSEKGFDRSFCTNGDSHANVFDSRWINVWENPDDGGDGYIKGFSLREERFK